MTPSQTVATGAPPVLALQGPALRGRVVLVAGAHGGLGQAASLAAARAGATVVLLGRKVPKLNRVHDAIVRDGGEALLYPLDLEGATPDDYLELAQRIAEGPGRLDGLLHCAADFRGLTPLEHVDPADFARTLHVDVTARWWLTQACLPLLRAAPDAALVFAVDAEAAGGGPYWGAYGLAQAALTALVSTLHEELRNSAVRVCGLAPGPLRTPLRAKAYVQEEDVLAREPDALAPACVHLLSAAGADQRGRVWSPPA